MSGHADYSDWELTLNQGAQEMILVPRQPTKEMLMAAADSALAEDAASVWRDMIEAWSRRNEPKT